jgi:hypothetical protein
MRTHDYGATAGSRSTMVVALAAVVAALLAVGTALFVFGLANEAVPGTSAGAADTAVTDTGAGGEVATLAFPGRPAPPGDEGGATDPGYGEPDPPADPPPSGTALRTMDDLKASGWTCTWSPISGGIYICSKKGEKDFYCSSPSACEQLLKGTRPEHAIDLSGGVNAPVTPGKKNGDVAGGLGTVYNTP